MKPTLWILLLAATAGVVSAQQAERNVFFHRKDAGEAVTFSERVPGPGMVPVAIQFMTSEMSGRPVKGAPYSGKGVTETTQVLADGNRIRRTSGGMLYRDSEGRTRREQSLAGLGPLAPAEAMQMVFIMDPVEGTSYMLDPRLRTAHKTPAMPGVPARFAGGGTSTATAAGGVMFHQVIPPPPDGAAGAIGAAPGVVMMRKRVEAGPADVVSYAPAGNMGYKNEDLGTQMVEGVQATGTRTVMTIAAGEIGNERPIEVVSERWFSPELQVVVMTKNSDPRVGETIYRLTNISRAEPPRSLFEVPADYTVDEPKLNGRLGRWGIAEDTTAASSPPGPADFSPWVPGGGDLNGACRGHWSGWMASLTRAFLFSGRDRDPWGHSSGRLGRSAAASR